MTSRRTLRLLLLPFVAVAAAALSTLFLMACRTLTQPASGLQEDGRKSGVEGGWMGQGC